MSRKLLRSAASCGGIQKGTMTKDYYIEIKFKGNKWTLVKTEKSHKEALEYVRENSGEKYPMRVVRVVRTVVFDGSK
jgi:hypothetical protein